jgi:hypothetical protein
MIPSLSWSNRAFLAALALLACSAAGFGTVLHRYGILLRKEAIYPSDGRLLNSIPNELGSFRQVGADRRENPEVEKVLGTENYISRVYVENAPANGADPIVIDVHLAYYTGTIDTVPHVPDRCFVGGGMAIGEVLGNLDLPFDQSRWRPDNFLPEQSSHLNGSIFTARTRSNTYPRLPRDPSNIKMRTMKFLDREGRPFYSGYFFVANGGAVSRAEDVRRLAFNLKTRYAYYMKVQVTTSSVSSGEEFARACARLLDDLLPEAMLCAPDWVEVEAGQYPPPRDSAPSLGQSPKDQRSTPAP